jgi:hypothetical protein
MNFTNKNYTNVLRIFHHISFITYMDYMHYIILYYMDYMYSCTCMSHFIPNFQSGKRDTRCGRKVMRLIFF